jgi:hypothetical protein
MCFEYGILHARGAFKTFFYFTHGKLFRQLDFLMKISSLLLKSQSSSTFCGRSIKNPADGILVRDVMTPNSDNMQRYPF